MPPLRKEKSSTGTEGKFPLLVLFNPSISPAWEKFKNGSKQFKLPLHVQSGLNLNQNPVHVTLGN